MRIPVRSVAPSLLTLAVAALVVAGCGGDSGASSKGSTKHATTKTTPPAGIRGNDAGPSAGQAEGTLRIRITNVGDKSGVGIALPATISCDRRLPATCAGTFSCPAKTGDEQQAVLCRWLAATGVAALKAAAPAREVCTQQYGGPEVATVTGTVDGESIDARFTRTDGCSIARFDDVSPLWTGQVPAQAPPTAGTRTVPRQDVISDPPEAFSH